MEKSIHSSESPSEAVKRLVAEQENCQQSQLGDLDNAVDMDALNQLHNPIEFHYCGYQIIVTADEAVKIES